MSTIREQIADWMRSLQNSVKAAQYQLAVALSDMGSTNMHEVVQTVSAATTPATPEAHPISYGPVSICGASLQIQAFPTRHSLTLCAYSKGELIGASGTATYTWQTTKAPLDTPAWHHQPYTGGGPGCWGYINICAELWGELSGGMMNVPDVTSSDPNDPSPVLAAFSEAAAGIGASINVFTYNGITYYISASKTRINESGGVNTTADLIVATMSYNTRLGEYTLIRWRNTTVSRETTDICATSCRTFSAGRGGGRPGPGGRPRPRPRPRRPPRPQRRRPRPSRSGDGIDPWIVFRTLCESSTELTEVVEFVAPNIFLDPEDLAEFILWEEFIIEGEFHPKVELEFITPGAQYNLQTGNDLLGYNNPIGGFVYDTILQKWGKFKHTHKAIVEIPTSSGHTNIGPSAGLLNVDGKIYIFDDQPADSWIRYGKMGYYRLGMVHFLETRIDFRTPSTGNIELDFSLDGRNSDPSINFSYTYSDEVSYRMYPNQRSRWMTVKISGNYDLQYMEIRGNISNRR
jgi:hypothetical protein